MNWESTLGLTLTQHPARPADSGKPLIGIGSGYHNNHELTIRSDLNPIRSPLESVIGDRQNCLILNPRVIKTQPPLPPRSPLDGVSQDKPKHCV